MNPQEQVWKGWVSELRGIQKSAADNEALNMKDPNCKGTPTIPDDTVDRSKIGLPTNQTNSNNPGTMPTNILATQTTGVGEGEYTKPGDGNAKDEAFTSPTVSLDKIANELRSGVADLKNTAKEAAAAAPAPASAPAQTPAPEVPAPAAPPAPAPTQVPATPQPEKVASQDINLEAQIKNDPDLMSKMAHFGLAMCSTSEGMMALERQLKKAAGIAEARALINAAQAEMQAEVEKRANAESAAIAAASQTTPEQMAKVAAAKQAHEAVLSQLATPFEKAAYAQGAADAEMLDASLQQGGPAAIPGMEEDTLSEEDILSAAAELVQAGLIPAEAIDTVLQELAADSQPGGSVEELGAALEAAVQSGQLPPEQAQALLQAILANDPEVAAALGAEGGAPEEVPAEGGEAAPAPEEAPVEDPTKAAAAEAIAKSAAVLKELFAPEAA